MKSRSALLPLVLFAIAVLGASPARADRCDDLARQLKNQIDGLNIERTAANVIFLTHPSAKQLRLGCPSRSVTNDIYAASDGRKPTPAFFDLVANAAAIVFTIPKPDTLKGAQRCIGRMGLFRGDDVTTRYRRLDMHCTRNKTGATITIARSNNE